MLERIRAGLVEYLAGLELGDGASPTVFFRRPGPGWLDGHDGAALSAYCVGLEDHDARSRRPTPELRLTARYLVTAWHAGGDLEEATAAANALLGRLWKALMLRPMKREPEVNPFIEMLQDPVPLDLWRALEVPPRPALWLRVAAAEDRPIAPAPPVEFRVFSGLGPPGTAPLSGKVTAGLDDKPMAGALVSLPELGRQTRCDQLGNYLFAEVPVSPLPLVVVEHGGERIELRAGEREDGLTPVYIHFET